MGDLKDLVGYRSDLPHHMRAPFIIGWRRKDDFEWTSSAPQSWLLEGHVSGLWLETYGHPTPDDYLKWLAKQGWGIVVQTYFVDLSDKLYVGYIIFPHDDVNKTVTVPEPQHKLESLEDAITHAVCWVWDNCT